MLSCWFCYFKRQVVDCPVKGYFLVLYELIQLRLYLLVQSIAYLRVEDCRRDYVLCFLLVGQPLYDVKNQLTQRALLLTFRHTRIRQGF